MTLLGSTWLGLQGKKRGSNHYSSAVQHWLNLREAAGDLASSSLTALVDLGGDFGRSGQIAQVEGGAICGLLKNLNREYPETFMRVVDADADLSEATLCERFVAEMGDAAGPVEISLTAHGRQVAAVGACRTHWIR